LFSNKISGLQKTSTFNTPPTFRNRVRRLYSSMCLLIASMKNIDCLFTVNRALSVMPELLYRKTLSVIPN